MKIEEIKNFRNLQLAEIWKLDYEERLIVMMFISSKWNEATDKIWKCHKKADYVYASFLIHDGNGSNGLLNWVIRQFKEEGKLPKDLSGWDSSYQMIKWLRHAEVYLLLQGETL
jgi:hypothetical protein